MLEQPPIDSPPDEAAAAVVDLSATGADAQVDYRALLAFNRDPASRTLAGVRVHHPIPDATLGRFRAHGKLCRTALGLSSDLHAAAGLVLVETLESGAAGLAAALERLHGLIESDWSTLAPPLKPSRPAKAWNGRKDAIEVLRDRAMDVAFLHRLPVLGLDGDARLCRRAFLVASGEHAAAGLVLDPPKPRDDGAPSGPGSSEVADRSDPSDGEAMHCTEAMLRTALGRLAPETLVALRDSLARAAALAGVDGIGARFAERARETSAALGAEARGETLSLEPLARWCEQILAGLDRLAPGVAALPETRAAATSVTRGAEAPSGAVPAPAAPVADAPTVADAGEAGALLEAAIDRFCLDEPGSPSLAFLTLAETLHGGSIAATVAALDPGEGGSFLDALARLDAPLDALVLGRDASEIADRLDARRAGAQDAEAGKDVRCLDRHEARAALGAVAAFLRADSPSSVVPALIERGAALSTARFEDIVGELVRTARADTGNPA